jgi:hypothetical protein
MSCLAPVGVNPATGIPFMNDQEQQEQGERILAALAEAVRLRQREPMRTAMGNAGRFLLSARDGMADGAHDSVICTRISARIRTLEFVPKFAWL